MTGPLISIIVPTMNEAQNIQPLLARLGQAMKTLSFEVLFVDDSTDDTPQVIQALQDTFPFPVRLLHRSPGERDGLSGAVVAGLTAVHGTWVCVMDGDLQHPPEIVPQMWAKANKTGADLVVGCRRANILGPMGLTLFRTLTSQALTILARALFPRSLKDVSDPLTGLFLVKRECVFVERLRPDGFKILLEILVRCPGMRIAELIFDFAERQAGDSKADVREGMRFFRHLLWLRATAHQRQLWRYLWVGAGSVLLNSLLLVAFVEGMSLPALWGMLFATELSDLAMFWGQRRAFPPTEMDDGRFRHYVIMAQLVLFGLRLPLFMLLIHVGQHYVLANLVVIVITSIVRYMLSDRWIWTRGLLTLSQATFHYDIHGQVRLESPVALPDLAYFHVPQLAAAPDITIRVDRHGTPRQQLAGSVSYDERLGRIGFAVTVLPGDDYVEVVVAPLVAKSPHVLYIYVVEPILRWLFLQRGFVLARVGCVVVNGRARLISAPSLSTVMTAVWQALKEDDHNCFLSHDLTLIQATGEAFNFPKPIILHKALETPWIRWLGARLRRRLPTATINAFVQSVWPPRQAPLNQQIRYASITDRAQIDDVVLLDDTGQPVVPEDVVTQLVANGRDEYGFPLYDLLITQADPTDGQTLLTRERAILREALVTGEIS